MNNSIKNKKAFIKLVIAKAEQDSDSVEKSLEFLNLEEINTKEIISNGLEFIKEVQTENISRLNSKYSFSYISKKMDESGFDSKLFYKILPPEIKERIYNKNNILTENLLTEIFSILKRVFKWDSIEVFNHDYINFGNRPVESAFFKTRSNVNINQIKAYSHYALYLAEMVNRINIKPAKFEYPENIDEFRQLFYDSYENLNLENLINLTWDLGIAVIPLNDSGVFHGASWNINNKHVIVLKQKNQSHSRWIFDLLHEIYHVFVHLETENSEVLEFDEMTPFRENDSPEEAESNTFANQFIFKGKSEIMAKEIIELSNNDIMNFKKTLNLVAIKHNVREDLLANYLAYRLNFQGENWWSTANTFQVNNPHPFKIASDILRERVSFANLDPIDKNLLTTAIEY